MTAPNTQNTTEDPRLTFGRDFPSKPPEGITLIPFSAWQERGICINPRADDPDELEVDALTGTPTIAMPKVHGTDKCKTNTKRKKIKAEAKRKALESGGKAAPFWEQWELDEDGRIAKPTNSSDSRANKLIAAASDFEKGRSWPTTVNSQYDTKVMFQKIAVYLGVEAPVKPAAKPKNKKVFHDLPPDDFDIDSDDEMEADDGDDDVLNEPKNKKISSFLDDPERSVKIYLSSYARAKGLIWSKINLEQIPRLWIFFLKFLIRSRVFPRSEGDFRAALAVAEQALIELPLTGVLSGILPDDFSRACRGAFGSKAEQWNSLELDAWAETIKGTDSAGQTAEQGDTIEIISDEVELEDPGPRASGWGSIPSTWDSDTTAMGSTWGSWNDMEGTGKWAMDADDEEPAAETNVWETPIHEQPFLMRFVGPTLFPLTHTTGVVEQSFRRITELIPISTNIPPKQPVSQDEPIVNDPAGVEAELERQFPKVVLNPWLDWEGGEMPGYAEPRILNTSSGPVVDPPYATRAEGDPAPPATNPKTHDPGNDSITVLVQPESFEQLRKGMCLAGTWVQIVRQPVEVVEAAEADAPAKKKKKSKKKKAADLWYMEEVGGVFPSYWTTKK